jgi:hypothetical protein
MLTTRETFSIAASTRPSYHNPGSPVERAQPLGQALASRNYLGRRSLILRGGGFALMNCGSSLFRDRGEVPPCLAHAKPNRPITFRHGVFGEGDADVCVPDILFGL